VDRGAGAVGGPQLQGLAGGEEDLDRLDVGSAVDDLDDGVGRLVAEPAVEGLADGGERRAAADLVVPLAGGGAGGTGCGGDSVVGQKAGSRAEVTPVLAAAEVVGEPVVIGDPHPLPGRVAGREDDPPQHGVDRDLVALWPVEPVAEVGRHDVGERDRLRQRVAPQAQALAGAVVVGRSLVEGAATDPGGHVQLAGDGGRARLGLGSGDEWDIVAEDAEGVAMARTVDAVRRGRGHGIGFQAPDEQPDVGDVVPARSPPRGDAADRNGVRHLVEWPVDAVEGIAAADVDCAAAVEPEVVKRLVEGQQREELDRPRRPAGEVGRELFEQGQGALAAPGRDGVGDVAAREAQLTVGHAVSRKPDARAGGRLKAEEVGQIGNYPWLAGLDEPVVVETIDVPLDDRDLLRDHLQQRPQRLVALGVAQPVDSRQQVVEPVARPVLRAHRVTSAMVISFRISVSGTAGERSASWAGRMPRNTTSWSPG
jgi:hypothetical protein